MRWRQSKGANRARVGVYRTDHPCSWTCMLFVEFGPASSYTSPCSAIPCVMIRRWCFGCRCAANSINDCAGTHAATYCRRPRVSLSTCDGLASWEGQDSQKTGVRACSSLSPGLHPALITDANVSSHGIERLTIGLKDRRM